MPSPFPGMDPYLEGDRWIGFHSALTSEIARQLSPQLHPRYVALVNRKDVRAGGGERVPHFWVEVQRPTRPDLELVTVIEVVLLEMKRGEAREEYLARRSRTLRKSVHLIEIDLVRDGQRLPIPGSPPAIPFSQPYLIWLNRAESPTRLEAWPVGLRERLPQLPVPLGAGEADLPMDLQETLNTLYDVFGYGLVLNYRRPPPVQLTPQEQMWADEQIRAYLDRGRWS